MPWHVTWQDPVALTLAVLGLALSFWLRRVLLARGAGGPCTKCDARQGGGSAASAASPTRVSLGELRMGRR